MTTFTVGAEVYNFKIEGKNWIIKVSEVHILTNTEIANNKKHNDGLGNYEPENEKPTSSWVALKAESENGDKEIMYWGISDGVLRPHISRPGWTKALFASIVNALVKTGQKCASQ